MIKISIIVPVYNTEKYLKKCLDSLINQTLKDIEIICINDGSPDNSLKILKEYEKKDKRIKIIDQENQGVSVARNNGIKIANGEYIGFVDSDDYVDLDFYEKLYNDSDNVELCSTFLDNSKITNQIYYYFTNCIYKRKFIIDNNIYFPENVTNSEDRCFLWKAVLLSNKINYTKNTHYHYIKRNGSAEQSAMSNKKTESIITSVRIRYNLLNQYEKDKKEYNYLINILFYDIYYIFRFEHVNNDILKQLFDLIYFIKLNFKFKVEYSEDIYKKIVDFNNFDEFKKIYKNVIFIFKPLLKIEIFLAKKKFYLFNFINILTIKNKYNRTYYRLFGFIPIFNKTTKNYYNY